MSRNSDPDDIMVQKNSGVLADPMTFYRPTFHETSSIYVHSLCSLIDRAMKKVNATAIKEAMCVYVILRI